MRHILNEARSVFSNIDQKAFRYTSQIDDLTIQEMHILMYTFGKRRLSSGKYRQSDIDNVQRFMLDNIDNWRDIAQNKIQNYRKKHNNNISEKFDFNNNDIFNDEEVHYEPIKHIPYDLFVKEYNFIKCIYNKYIVVMDYNKLCIQVKDNNEILMNIQFSNYDVSIETLEISSKINFLYVLCCEPLIRKLILTHTNKDTFTIDCTFSREDVNKINMTDLLLYNSKTKLNKYYFKYVQKHNIEILNSIKEIIFDFDIDEMEDGAYLTISGLMFDTIDGAKKFTNAIVRNRDDIYLEFKNIELESGKNITNNLNKIYDK